MQLWNKKLQTLILEGLAIVLSILLAFAIDAGWEERRERAEEQEVIKSLITEFRANREEVELVLSIHQRQIWAIASLMEKTDQQVLSLSQEEVEKIVRSMASPWGFDAVRGAIDALIGAGKLGILENRVLREALTTFVGLDEAAAKDRSILFQRAHLVWNEQIRNGGPWRSSRGSLSEEECDFADSFEVCTLTDPRSYLPVPTPADLLRLKHAKILMGHVHQNKEAAWMYTTTLLQIQVQIEKILTLLQESQSTNG